MSKKLSKTLSKQANTRAYLREYLDKEITITCTVKAIQDVASVGFVGKSVLLSNLSLPNIDHLWVHLNEFKNFNVNTHDWQVPIKIKGTVYQYSRENNRKIWKMKYSLKNVEVIT